MTNWALLIAGAGLLLFAGFTGADSVSSTIVVNGASWVSSSVLGQGQTYAESMFTTDLAVLMRNLDIQKNQVMTQTNVRSSGPMGIDEYSAQNSNGTRDPDTCVFENRANETPSHSEIMYTGLMQTGQYASTRDLKPGNYAVTMVNGSGIILARANSFDGNQTTTHSSDVAGQLNMTERIIFGGER